MLTLSIEAHARSDGKSHSKKPCEAVKLRRTCSLRGMGEFPIKSHPKPGMFYGWIRVKPKDFAWSPQWRGDRSLILQLREVCNGKSDEVYRQLESRGSGRPDPGQGYRHRRLAQGLLGRHRVAVRRSSRRDRVGRDVPQVRRGHWPDRDCRQPRLKLAQVASDSRKSLPLGLGFHFFVSIPGGSYSIRSLRSYCL